MRFDADRGTFVCDHCGGKQELPAALAYVNLGSETANLCPLCSTPLAASHLDGYPLLCCGRCSGMLIAMNCFAAAIDAVRIRENRSVHTIPARDQAPGDRTIACPMCGKPMLAHIYGGPGNVVIDSCEGCQVNWLDPGELRRIALAPDGAALRRPRDSSGYPGSDEFPG
jgi:Zn-finger nucleic acid-binding protein